MFPLLISFALMTAGYSDDKSEHKGARPAPFSDAAARLWLPRRGLAEEDIAAVDGQRAARRRG